MDYVIGYAGNDQIFGYGSNDTLDGGAGNDSLDGGADEDTVSYASAGSSVTVDLGLSNAQSTGGGGTDTLANFENLIGSAYDDELSGNAGTNRIDGAEGNDTLISGSGVDWLTGGLGNDLIDGGSDVDTVIVSGNLSAYTVSQPTTGTFTVTGPDGTDTLSNVEYLHSADFTNQTLRLLPGAGIPVNFETNQPSIYQAAMDNILDFDGNALGGNGGWLRIGSADVNGDGDTDQVLVNRTIARFAEVGTAPDGLVYFSDNGWAGETRVVGIYIDPLVQSGEVVAGTDHDSQRRFQNDLSIENINRVLGAGDYDHDGLQEVYFGLTDGTAYLHAYMHADGNIRYANYQDQTQVIDFLTTNGWASSTYDGWFG